MKLAKETNFLIVIIVVISFGVFICSKSNNKPSASISNPDDLPAISSQEQNEISNLFPFLKILHLPMKYFAKEDISTGWSDGNEGYTEAFMDSEDAYQSYPTTNIMISENEYSNEISDLPPIRTIETILAHNKKNNANSGVELSIGEVI